MIAALGTLEPFIVPGQPAYDMAVLGGRPRAVRIMGVYLCSSLRMSTSRSRPAIRITTITSSITDLAAAGGY